MLLLRYALIFVPVFADYLVKTREKRQLPGLGGLTNFGLGDIAGMGLPVAGSGLSRIPALSPPNILQPAAGKPCPVALMPQQFGGGLSIQNPFSIGINLKGQDAKNGPWGTGFDTALNQEYGGNIFGDAGHAAVPIECKEPQKSTGGQTSGSPQTQRSFPISRDDDPMARVLSENPDLLQRALMQNPDLMKGAVNREQVESALMNDPERIRQTLLKNPDLIREAVSQLDTGFNNDASGQSSESDSLPPPPVDPALKNAVIRKLAKDSTAMRKFVEHNGYSIRLALKRSGISRTLSDSELMRLLASNPAILDQIFLAKPELVSKVAKEDAVDENWDTAPVKENWGGPQAGVFDAFSNDPFFMEHVLINEPVFLNASMKKGRFDTGDLTDDQVRQVLYDHPEYVRAMLARDTAFTKHIQKKYGVVAGKEYNRKEPSRAELAFEYIMQNRSFMQQLFRENPTDIENAVKKQKVDPAKVSMAQIMESYLRRPEKLKLMLLQNPGLVTKAHKAYGKTATPAPEVKIRTGIVNTQVLRKIA